MTNRPVTMTQKQSLILQGQDLVNVLSSSQAFTEAQGEQLDSTVTKNYAKLLKTILQHVQEYQQNVEKYLKEEEANDKSK